MPNANARQARNPKLPAIFEDAPEKLGTSLIIAVACALGCAFIGLVIAFVFDLLGVGGFGLEKDPSNGLTYGGLPLLGAILGAVSAFAHQYVVPRIFPPLEFDSSTQAEMYRRYLDLPDSDKDSLRAAVTAYTSLGSNDPRLYEYRILCNDLFEALDERKKLMALSRPDPHIEDARHELEILRTLNQQLREETRQIT